MIACPSCNRRIFTRRDMLFAILDGAARCRSCGGTVRLDVSSRWILSCVLAIVLPNLLLYGGVFYSGHLFLISIVIVVGAWAMLSVVGFPLLKLEAVARSSSIDRRKNILALIAVLIAAIVIDSYMRSRFD